MPNAFERICDAVRDSTGQEPKRSSTGAKGICPAHADDKASLSIRDTTPVGVTCFAGCSFLDIRDALGLTNRDFRDPKEHPEIEPEERHVDTRRKGNPGVELARYAYHDESGRPLYYNIRFDPKDFRMAGPDGKVGKLPANLVRVPYNLPAVIRAVRDGRRVYWVEGEKDVASLAARGEVGTTSAGGANAAIEESWAQWFKGADLVVVQDNDKVGGEYARKVARTLVNACAQVQLARPLVLDAKADLTDHFDAGHELADLVQVPMRGVRRTRFSFSTVLATEPPPLRWAIEGVIPEGLTLLVGAPKAGKSWWNMNIAVALTSGRPDDVFAWGQPAEPSPFLYLALEDPFRRVHTRLKKVLSSLTYNPATEGDIWLELPPINKGGKNEIEQWLDDHPTARCVMVDVLAKVRTTDNSDAGMYQADYESIGALKDIADSRGIAMVVTHHDRKKTSDDFLDNVSGTKGITGAADTILYLERKRGTDEGIMRCESRDVEECTYDLQFVREQGRWHIQSQSFGGESDDSPAGASKADDLEMVLLARGPSTAEELAKHTGLDQVTVGTMLRKLKGEGKADRVAGKWELQRKSVGDAPE